jgi:hypothetical protein
MVKNDKKNKREYERKSRGEGPEGARDKEESQAASRGVPQRAVKPTRAPEPPPSSSVPPSNFAGKSSRCLRGSQPRYSNLYTGRIWLIF